MKYAVAILLFFLPTSVVRLFLFGSKNYVIKKKVKIGFSLIIAKCLFLDEGSSIGSLNYINVNKCKMGGVEYVI